MGTKKPNVTIVGHLCIDRNDIEGSKYVSWGSPAMYVSGYYKREFGIKPKIISSRGVDFKRYEQDFHILGDVYQQTLVYENVVRNGSRTQYCHNHATSLPVEIDAKLKKVLNDTDVLIIAPILPNYNVTYVKKLIQNVSDDCIKMLMPQGYMRHIRKSRIIKRKFAESETLLTYFDIVILSDEDHANALENALAWSKAAREVAIVVTQSARGASLIQSGAIHHISTKPLTQNEIVSSVGAGDVFSAHLAIEIYSGLDLRDAMRKAHSAASKALTSSPLPL